MKKKNIVQLERDAFHATKPESHEMIQGYPVWKLDAYAKLWSGFTDNMKAAFRKICRPNAYTKRRAIAASTYRALRQRGVLMETKKSTDVLSPNWRGCELLDYLRISKQKTKDRVGGAK